MADRLEQLREHGFCVVNVKTSDAISDSAMVVDGWFEQRTEQQKLTVRSTADAAADSGRGYIKMPAKEVLEVKKSWKCPSAPPELRLAANTAYAILCKIAQETLQHIFSSSAILSGATQQLQELLGQKSSGSQTPGDNQQQSTSSDSDRSSVLHINRYKPSPAAAAATDFLLQGTEAHVDKGLLTVIWSTQPGLQVFSRDGSWLPVPAGPNQLVILVGHTLSFLTAGRLPAAMHRVMMEPADSSTETSTPARLSLCFKLHAAPEAVLSPTSVKPGTTGTLPARFQVSKTVKQLMEEFDASHTSIHSQRSHMQQQRNMQPVAPAAAVPVKREPSSSPEHAAKRPCQQPVPGTAHSMNPSMPQPQHRDGQLRLILRGGSDDDEDVHFIVRPSLPLSRVFTAYLERIGKMHEIGRYRFMHMMVRISPDRTPMYYDMENGDIIHAFLEQTGD